ncbi:response regulator transcription factor [Larkinella harenae]
MASVVNLETFYTLFGQALGAEPPEFGQFNLFRIEDMKTIQQPAHSRRNYFKVSLLIGPSKIHYADRSLEVTDKALIFTNPMIPYFWERIGENHHGFVCVFTEAFFSRFGSIREYPVFQSADAAVVPLSEGDFQWFLDLFGRMLREIQGNYAYKYDLLRNLLMEVIHEAQKRQPAPGNSLTASKASERIAALFVDLLERQFPIDLSLQAIVLRTPAAFATQLNIHVNHLNKSLKEITGLRTSQLINQRIYQEARILLKSTDWPVNEIAWSLGFDEPQHFSSFFKKHSRVTPTAFRKARID